MAQVSGHGEKRSRLEDAAIVALLAEPTIGKAAVAAGVSESTLYNWLEDPSFQARYRDARRQVLEQAVSQLQRAAGQAVTVLVEIAEDGAAPQAARVSAAKTILDQAFRGLELLDLAAEVAELKRRQADGEAADDSA